MNGQNQRVVAVIVLLPLAIALALWAFIWPNARLEPRDLPIGVAGPAQATAPVEKQFAERSGPFDVHRYADENAARDAIKDRDVYGAVVVGQDGAKLLTATAASPMVAQLLTTTVSEQAADGMRVSTEDVVPTPAADPRGVALNSSVLPLALAGVASGGLITLMGLRGTRAMTALGGAAALVGLTAAGITQGWLDVIPGNFWALTGSFALAVLAGGTAVAGLGALLGQRGLGLGALLVVLLGNPFSGVTSAPEMLPQSVGLPGQWLPPGAGGSLLRSVAFFDGNGASGPLLTLSVWTLLGLAAVALAALQRRGQDATPAPVAPAAGSLADARVA